MRLRQHNQPVIRSSAIGAYGVLLIMFVLLSIAVAHHEYVFGDLAITRAIQSIDLPAFHAIMVATSLPGYPAPAALINLIMLLGFWYFRRDLSALFVILTTGGVLLVGLLKLVEGRIRPSTNVVDLIFVSSGYSYPSGHVTHYVVFFGFLLFLAWRIRQSVLRAPSIAICSLLILLVGPSRIYLGVHWPSDVLGGYLLGILYLYPLILLYRALENSIKREPARWRWLVRSEEMNPRSP